MNKNDKLAAEITEVIMKSGLASTLVAHGSFTVNRKIALAYNATDEELGQVADLLNRVNQSPLMKGKLISVRGTLSARVTLSMDDTIIGKVLQQAMNNVVADSIVSIRAGEAPTRLYRKVVAKGGAVLSQIDFRLASATIGALGIKIGKDDRNAIGLEQAILRQVSANKDNPQQQAPVIADKPATPSVNKDEVEAAADADEPTAEELEANTEPDEQELEAAVQ